MLNKIGKKGREWENARRKLKKIYYAKEITTCELMFEGCFASNFLSFAHRYKRRDPRCKHTFEQTILACINCHNKIEYNKELTEQMFSILRG